MLAFDAAVFSQRRARGMQSVAAATHSCGEKETVGAAANHFHMVK
ncbi:MAG TPA: hypothetical protein VFG64_07200 [Dongiaceae bacterium]|jgi:hypothetical protein|nr:hypothetical protein [Dongiaceae bacterium]